MIDRPPSRLARPPAFALRRARARRRLPIVNQRKRPPFQKMRHVAAAQSSSSPRARHPRPSSSSLDDRTHATAPTRRSRPPTTESELFPLPPSLARTTTRSSGQDAHEAARIPTSPRRADRACDARRAMRSLSATKERHTRSTRASIFDGFFSSPIRVFYSILFICALEVRARRDVVIGERPILSARARAESSHRPATTTTTTTDGRLTTRRERARRFYSGPSSWFPDTRRARGTTRRGRITRARRCVQNLRSFPSGGESTADEVASTPLTLTFFVSMRARERCAMVSDGRDRRDARD